MTTRKLIGGLFAAALMVMTSPLPAKEQPPVELRPAVAKYLAPLLGTNNFSGVVAIAHRGKIVFSQGYGYASVEFVFWKIIDIRDAGGVRQQVVDGEPLEFNGVYCPAVLDSGEVCYGQRRQGQGALRRWV